MNSSTRDLLVMFNQDLMPPNAMEHELNLLHELLFNVERINNLVVAHEIIDLNRYKIICKPVSIRKFLRLKKEQAFVFLNNKN